MFSSFLRCSTNTDRLRTNSYPIYCDKLVLALLDRMAYLNKSSVLDGEFAQLTVASASLRGNRNGYGNCFLYCEFRTRIDYGCASLSAQPVRRLAMDYGQSVRMNESRAPNRGNPRSLKKTMSENKTWELAVDPTTHKISRGRNQLGWFPEGRTPLGLKIQ